MTNYSNNTPAKLKVIKASEITPKEVRWLWYPYSARPAVPYDHLKEIIT